MVAVELPRPDALSDLRTAVDLLAAEVVDDRDPAAEAKLIELRRQIDRLEAEFCRRLRPFDRARGFVRSGAANVAAWLRSACRLSASGAHERVEVAHELGALPEVEEAWRRSDIGYQHAAVLARSVREVGLEPLRAGLDELLDTARRVDPSRLRTTTRYLRYFLSPDGARASENDAYERRYLDMSQTVDGVVVVNGQLDAEGGALFRAAVNALDKPLPDETRTAGQRRADAAVELARRQLRCGQLPTTHGQRPHLTVTVPESTVSGSGCEPGDLAGSGPVSRELVQRLACDAAITPVTVDSAGRAVAVIEASRVIPAALRTALAMRDRGCRFPGCDRPPEWTDAHHILPRSDDGKTKAENLTLLCRVHHRMVHEGGWRLTRAGDGGLEAMPP
jgi:hypothetical protein